MEMSVTAVVLAAGQGLRMGTQTPKQYLLLGDRPVVAHTLGWLQNSPLIERVVLVASKDRVAYCENEIVAKYELDKVKDVVSGGPTRQVSSLRGVSIVKTEYVLVHDAVRPLLDRDLVLRLLAAATATAAAAPVLELVDTVIWTNGNFLSGMPDRNALRRIQTPQAFKHESLYKAQMAAWADGIRNATDEAGLVYRTGGTVELVLGLPQLTKITYPSDLAAAECLMQLSLPTSIVDPEQAIRLVRAGEPIIISDSEDRENEGDLFIPADLVTPAMVNFMATHCRGLICHTITPPVAERLGLGLMTGKESSSAPAFTVSVDGKSRFGVTSGTSAFDRAKTVLAVLDENTSPDDLQKPGHVFPIIARPGLLQERLGHTEASCYLAAQAGYRPSGVICEILTSNGAMARMPQLETFAKKHGFKIVTIDALKEYADV